jgi:hypothetical protein
MWTTKICPPILKPRKAWGLIKFEHHWTGNSLVKSLNNGSSKLENGSV